MSLITFNSLSGDAHVRGPERFQFGAYVASSLLVALRLDREIRTDLDREWALRIARLIPSMGLAHPDRVAYLPVYLRNCDQREFFDLGDRDRIDLFSLALNTLIATGSDPMILAARIHGQCEIHCYVEGPNRKWLAEIVERGRAFGIYRAEAGWDSVARLLRLENDKPVILSHSVSDDFPNLRLTEKSGIWARPEGDEDGNSWYDLSPEEQWDYSLIGLRKENRLELKPDDWTGYWFGESQVTAYHVAEIAAALPEKSRFDIQIVIEKGNT